MPKALNLATQIIVANIVTSDKAAGVFTANLRGLTASTATGRAIPVSDCVCLVLNSTALTGDGAANLRVFLQSSWDGGTTYATVAQFAAVTSSTDQQMIIFRSTGLGANEAAARISTVTGTNAALAQNTVLSADHRIGWTLASATVASASFVVGAICQPFGTSGV